MKAEECKDEKETTDINKEYDMDNYDDGKNILIKKLKITYG